MSWDAKGDLKSTDAPYMEGLIYNRLLGKTNEARTIVKYYFRIDFFPQMADK